MAKRAILQTVVLLLHSNTFGTGTFFPFADFKFNFVVFSKDGAVRVGHVKKEVVATFLFNKTKTFICTKKFYATLTHLHSPFRQRIATKCLLPFDCLLVDLYRNIHLLEVFNC